MKSNYINMKVIINKMITVAGLAAALVSCSDKAAQNGEFKYLIDEFARMTRETAARSLNTVRWAALP